MRKMAVVKIGLCKARSLVHQGYTDGTVDYKPFTIGRSLTALVVGCANYGSCGRLRERV